MTRPHPLRRALIAGLLTVLLTVLVAGPIHTQQKDSQKSDSDVFFDRLDVTVVNVEVFVTDKAGNSVTGLEAEDFELLEDGRPQEITQFYAVENGRATTAPSGGIGGGNTAGLEPLPEAPDPGRHPGAPPPAPESQALRLVVYFDNLFLRPTNRNKIVGQVQRFVRRALRRPNDLVMLATFDKSLHIRQPFTTDVDAFDEKLKEVETVAAFGQRDATERRDVIQRIEFAETALEAESHIDFYAKSRHFDVGQSINGLREVIGSLAGLPGRKALLYVSDGLPMTAAEDLYHLLEVKFPNGNFGGQALAAHYSSRYRFRELTAAANANGVTIYTLEATGLRSHSSLSAEYGSLGGEGSYVDIDAMRDMSLEEPLVKMAADTGGLAALNTNNIDGALERLSSDLGNYYSLGYAPAHAVQGRFHDIKVRVKGKGLKVRHRTGYRDKVPSTRVHEGTLATLLYGPQKNPLEIELSFAGARTQDDGERIVPLEVRIPLGQLALVPHENARRAQLRVAVAVIDTEGRLSPVDQQEFPIDIPEADVETARGQFYVYAVDLKMRRGDHMVAVGVHDDYSGETSFVRQAVRTGT